MKLTTKLEAIKGVGPKTAEQLHAAGLETVQDILYFLPRKHEDFTHLAPIVDLKPGKVTIKATCESVVTKTVQRGLKVTTAVLADTTGKVNAVWFNQPYRAVQLKADTEFYFSGEFEFKNGRYQLTSPSAQVASEVPLQAERLVPVYRSIKGLKSQVVRKILGELQPLMTMLPENLPNVIVHQNNLCSRAEAVSQIHFPKTIDEAKRARERLAFDELFELLLASQLNRQANTKLKGWEIPFDQKVVKSFVEGLPFALTNAQRRAAWDIVQDFEAGVPMNRLLQGDVGSGKTVVAGLAARSAAAAGYQSALMAPTEILASQHAETLHALLAPFGVRVALLVGSVKGVARKQLYAQLEDGEIDVLVGTHALFQPAVKFKKLGFVVIDEQHRFGVEQRRKLLDKSSSATVVSEALNKRADVSRDSRRVALDSRGRHDDSETTVAERATSGAMPHLLAMTATPIPRSLALTVYGELDISILNERPANRKPIKTQLISPISAQKVYAHIDAEITKGRQAYVICSLIDDNPENDIKSVETEYKRLKNSIFGHRNIGLLHGKMKADEKERVMQDFKDKKYDILVSTTVVEVGVDVPNASVIMIENADRFGLSQLHQLRGRVGRAEHQSYCYLMLSDTQKPSERLREIERSNDGFYLAEVDMKLRGPGEIYGRAQHGALNLQIASLADTELISRAQKAAKSFVASGEDLLQYKELATQVAKYQRLTTLN